MLRTHVWIVLLVSAGLSACTADKQSITTGAEGERLGELTAEALLDEPYLALCEWH